MRLGSGLSTWLAPLVALSCWLAACATTPGLAELRREAAVESELSAPFGRPQTPMAPPRLEIEMPDWWPSEDWPVQGSLMLMFGLRAVESHLGMAGKEQGGGIVEIALGPRSFPLGGEIGYSNMGYTREKDEPAIQWPWSDSFPGYDSNVSEIYFGPRLSFELKEGLRFYTGGGASYMTVSADTGSRRYIESGRDTTWAGYLHSGIIGHVDTFAVGFDLRYNTGGTVELFGEPVDVGYWQIAFGLGMAF